jgi:hypothetical protein
MTTVEHKSQIWLNCRGRGCTFLFCAVLRRGINMAYLFYCKIEISVTHESPVPWLRRLVAGLSPRRPGFAPGSIQRDLWRTKWHWDRFFSEFFGFPCQYHSTVGSTFPKVLSLIHPAIHPLIHPHPGTNIRPVKAAAVQWEVSLIPINKIRTYGSVKEDAQKRKTSKAILKTETGAASSKYVTPSFSKRNSLSMLKKTI